MIGEERLLELQDLRKCFLFSLGENITFKSTIVSKTVGKFYVAFTFLPFPCVNVEF